ncbi:GntR family transcriptional regulator [Variovorax sp. WS11]|uniref:GntR family transcriptional regulator n=1 Tax=Variovorax sp. WS11 TaxID=1105204 RepID=UPI000D0D3CCB|nr:GntR family transcriptional regulator [Variovorax sp. WS11]NDZ15941.1 GntR family transcriptional regulator [Variovorax sp. WS11]PSL80510.1 GntR family transcriptional regulator [Variovorax sp. WS11]
MASSTRPRRAPASPAAQEAPRRSSSPVNLSNLAYERLEELLVCCELKPGRFLATHELQAMVGYGRTPVLQAVNRLAADTLVAVTPRHGLQITPVDLTRDRVLLRLRRDMERFVIQLATERSGASQRNQMLHLKRQLSEHRADITLEQFNLVDRRIDQLFLAAAGEPFVESTLRPLHTIFRRIGWIYHMQTQQGVDLHDTVDGHIAVIDAVAAGKADAAIAASDRLMEFVEGMFDVLEREVDPALLDCSLGGLDATFLRSPAA